jgi:hypothetical protein
MPKAKRAKTATAARRRAVSKPWTVLVWIAGDNDLDEFGLSDIAEMKKVGSTADVDIVVQFDRMGNGKTARYHVKKGTRLAADVVEMLGETNTGDPAVAIDFFTWGMREYPSDKVLAVIWNHGSGIDETDVYARAASQGLAVERHAPPRRGVVPRSQARRIASSRMRRALFSTTVDAALGSKAIAYDDTSRDFLDNAELKRVLAEVVKQAGRPIDVLGLDACLMNMVEVAYQLRGLVGHIVASEEVEPGDGWPYDTVMEALAAKPGASGLQVARTIVDRYLKSYTAADGVTDSALDVSQVTALAQAVDTLAATAIGYLESDADYAAFGKAVKTAQRFQMRDFVDLGDLCRQIAARTPRADLRLAAEDVLARLGGAAPFVVAEGHKGRDLKNATGTAIYFPVVGDVHLTYDQLDFAKDTRWGDLIARFQTA